MRKTLLLLCLVLQTVAISQITTEKKPAITETEISISPLIIGTLFSPSDTVKQPKLVILIAGSGPTNRSGNQIGAQNNSLRYLAQGLAKEGIAVFSYDKRTIAQIIKGDLDENSVFEDFINDAKDVITHFKGIKIYSKIIVAGHSEGSLIGMVASQNNADGFISIAGPGRPVDEVLVEQLTVQMPDLKPEIEANLALLKGGKTFVPTTKNPTLKSLFRESIQPYLISMLKYDPRLEIKKLNIPVLVINGTNDIQVKVLDAENLKKAQPNAKLVIIENMNHVFKEVKGDRALNIATYSNPDLPVMPELVSAVNQFIKYL